MDRAKGGCLAVLMADAGWYGKVTGLCIESGIAKEVLRDVPSNMLCRMRPDMLPVEKHTANDVLPTLHELEHPRQRRTAQFMSLRWDLHRGSKCSETLRKI